MKNHIQLVAIFFFLTLMFMACTPNAPAPVHPTTTSVQVISKNIKKTAGTNPEKALSIDLNYPTISGGTESLALNVQNWIENVLTNLVVAQDEVLAAALPIEKCVERFSKDWEENAKNGVGIQAFTLASKDSVLFVSPKCLTLQFSVNVYTGGAHGNYATHIENFDPATGQKILTAQVIKNQEALLPLLDKKYRELKKEFVPESNNPYLNDKISFPANWGYLENGIVFQYNPYEVAAYALGDAQIFLTWEEMGDAVSKL